MPTQGTCPARQQIILSASQPKESCRGALDPASLSPPSQVCATMQKRRRSAITTRLRSTGRSLWWHFRDRHGFRLQGPYRSLEEERSEHLPLEPSCVELSIRSVTLLQHFMVPTFSSKRSHCASSLVTSAPSTHKLNGSIPVLSQHCPQRALF